MKDNVVDYLCAADVLVNPSLSESSPTVVREAMCCELPCIVTPVGDAEELVGDTGFCVPAERNLLVAALVKVLAMDRADLRSLGKIADRSTMPSFGERLSASELDDLVAFLATQRESETMQ